MVACIFHRGSGIGDQLFRYITCRTLALDKGFEFGVVCPENFKGKDFMKLDMGLTVSHKTIVEPITGKVALIGSSTEIINPSKAYIEATNYYDPEINFVEDNTVIDGNFQDERYWGHRLNEIREWLRVEPLEMPDDLCVINFRGGEFATVPELFLPLDYWWQAVGKIKLKYELFDSGNAPIRFEVHTDDPILAKQFFPNFPITQEIAFNWRSVRYTKHLILSNSAFGILPALLNENIKEIIAPRYWARRNTKQWSMPQNYYPKFTYV